ncbi:MAG: hypothetical protein EOL98_15650 [Negativicutes bacterium]|nr:hypothetical protein [Negativicutes bacterium]
MKYFIIPFVILILGFAALTYYTAENRIEERYATLEDTTLNIADSYSHSLANSREAYDIILELLDEKILVLIMDRSNVVPTVHNHVQYYAILHKTTNGSCHFDIIVL